MTSIAKRHRVLIADDHRIVMEGLKCILEPTFEIVDAVPDGRALVEAAAALKPHVVVTDISMPLLNGLEAMLQVKKSDARIKVVLLTGMPDVALATRALRWGASGYVLKASVSEELIAAIHEALEGRTYIAPRIAGEVFQNLMEGGGKSAEPAHELTPREREVLQLLAEGKLIKETASILEISPRTVEFHKANLQDKTGMRTTAELVRCAVRLGLISA